MWVRAGRCDRAAAKRSPTRSSRSWTSTRVPEGQARRTSWGSCSGRSRSATSPATSRASPPSATASRRSAPSAGSRSRRSTASSPGTRRARKAAAPGMSRCCARTRRTGTTRRSARSSRSTRSRVAPGSSSRSPADAVSVCSPPRRTSVIWGIGVDADQSFLGPQVLTSALKGVDQAVYPDDQGGPGRHVHRWWQRDLRARPGRCRARARSPIACRSRTSTPSTRSSSRSRPARSRDIPTTVGKS